MINPGDAIDAIVGALQAIPELVAAVGGAQNIMPYHPTFPGAMYFRQNLDQLQPGQMLIRYLGTVPGPMRENRMWKHAFGVYQKPPDTTQAKTSAAHYSFIFVINGIPTNGDGNRMIDYAAVPDCTLMDVPKIEIYTDLTLKQDYFFTQFVFPEIGDN